MRQTAGSIRSSAVVVNVVVQVSRTNFTEIMIKISHSALQFWNIERAFLLPKQSRERDQIFLVYM